MSNKDKCAPGKYDKKNNTCFSQKQLSEMAKAYNRYISKKKLSPSNKSNTDLHIISDTNADVKTLLKEFKTIFGNIDEKEITQLAFMKEIINEMYDDIVNETFRPDGPNGPTEWLSTIDINQIMVQYHNVYPDFNFLGAVPLDCDEVSRCSLFKIDFSKYHDEGNTKLGVIFNLDRHDEPGSHWVALYMDTNNGHIYFCDSVGNKPSKNINNIIEKFKEYYKKRTGKNATFKYNPKQYQRDGSECGVYSCNFIIRMLAGEPFDEIINKSLPFEKINGCRNKYFNNSPVPNNKVDTLCDPGERN